MTYDEAVAMSAARTASNPVMKCRCGKEVRAMGSGATYCDNGVHHFECSSCDRRWDSTRDWTKEDWTEFSKARWRSVHGRDPSPATLAWLNGGPYTGCDCDCAYCTRQRATLAACPTSTPPATTP